MSLELNEIEVRILGCLVEKESTTPDYYPLTLNALVNACNQKSSRFPIVNYAPDEVERTLARLNDPRLVIFFYGSTSRVTKYKHRLPEFYNLDKAETAVLSVLMLRGVQTQGELNQRTARLYEFEDLDKVKRTLDSLAGREDPLVLELPVQSGQKEPRYAHLLSGEIDLDNLTAAPSPKSGAAERTERLEAIGQEIGELRGELSQLIQEFEDFKQDFE